MAARIVSKPPKIKRIVLTKIGRTHGDVTRFGNALLDSLGDSIFDYTSRIDLVYDILSRISPTYRNLEKTNASIEKACVKILNHFGYNIKSSIHKITETGREEIITDKKNKTATDEFCEDIIQLAELPGPIFNRLSYVVEGDLKVITKLIQRYELEPFIQKYLQSDYIPTSQMERMTFDFYKRCVRERGEIIKYRLEGLKPRALQKARRVHSWLSNLLAISDAFYDRPYDFARPYSIHRFDSDQIDLASHRVGEFPVRESRKLEKIYTSDRAKFYRIYFKNITPSQHFQNLMYYVAHVPLRNDRKPIFEELIRLFKGRRWMGFYALALPQVEGLFSEMCEIALPKMDFSRRALPHKVESLRPYYSGSYNYFDYYQYYIPLQRNKFAHIGYDDDFKIKSFDLLSDLVHLLSVFYELDNPLVKINKLHARRNPEDFMTVSDLSHYFLLLQQLHPEQKKEIEEKTANFEIFLWDSCDLGFTCHTVIEEYPRLAQTYIDELMKQLSFLSSGVIFTDFTDKRINKLHQEAELAEIMIDQFRLHDNLGQLEACLTFLTSYKPLLDKMPTDIKTSLGAIVKEHSREIHTLSLLFDKFKSIENDR